MNRQRLIHPVILCGGSGTRLWPKSRAARPKPFLDLFGSRTLFQQALDRVSGDQHFAHPTIVAGAAHIDLIEQQATGFELTEIIVEPAGRNTAPAIGLAAARLHADDIVLVCPSDHYIADTAAFQAAALTGVALARDGYLVAFGIAPTQPETGYGYIKRADALAGGFKIERFVEKPDLKRAEAYLTSGDYSWNGGIFIFRAGTLLDELATHRPEIAKAVRSAVAKGEGAGGLFHPDAETFGTIEGDSIDYAVMENTHRAAMVPVDMGWSDIGNWAALQDALSAKAAGNIVPSNAALIECENVFVTSDGPRVSAIGLKDICIVVDGDEVLVTTRAGAQIVGKLPGVSGDG